MPSTPDPLDSLLRRSSSVPPAPGNLVPEVWRRIAATEKPAVHSGWAAQIDAVFSRPSFAAMFIAACALLGLFLAEVRLSRLQTEQNFQLVRSYLRLIDPLFDTAALSSRVTAVPPS